MTRGRNRFEKHLGTERGTPHAKCRLGCPRPPSPLPHKEDPSTGHVLKSRRQLADGEVELVGLRPPVVQKRAEEGESRPAACPSEESHPAACRFD
jgi:hypothetical protein